MRIAATLCGLVGALLVAHGVWIPAKARLAQVLLERSFERALALRATVASPPWPWADFRPVARLTTPDGTSHIVLDNAAGATLAFGPGHVDGTGFELPDERRHQVSGTRSGNIALAGHRDTSFAFLETLRPGDIVHLEPLGGPRVAYRVAWLRVVDRREVAVLGPTLEPSLTLVTCWPFDRAAGGDERYIVRAVAESAGFAATNPSVAPFVDRDRGTL